MDRATAEAAVRFGFAHSTRTVDLSFFGGEPLLEKDLLLHTADYALAWQRDQAPGKPLRLFVTTNGLGLDEAFLQEARRRGLIVSLSLDGHGRGHDLTRTLPEGGGSFAALEPKFPAILAVFPWIEVLVTVTPRNLPFLGEGVEKLYACGFRNFIVGPNYEEAWEEPALQRLEEEYRRLASFYEARFRDGHYIYLSLFDTKIAAHTRTRGEICSCCDKNDGEIAVAPSGNIYPCLRFVKEDADHALVLGTLATGLDRKKRAKLMLEAGREWPECLECAFRGRCFHYCTAVNFKVTGRFNQPPAVLCRQEQAAIRCADEVAARLHAAGNPLFHERFYRK